MTRSILFVCLGNICRSPTAEGVLRSLAGEALTVDSAGTGSWHVGEPPCPPMIEAAARRGVDISGLRARQMNRADFARFDLIIGMDDANIADIERLRPAGDSTPVRLFTDYAPETGAREIPDAYYTHDYEGALDLIEHCAEGLWREVAT
ncbi:MAG TPA: low molecular weight phosphotyrosine protein phosphatase [Rhodobacterales bacterium]|nr:low molecular weight phosphotyrosine protein phosphatase [Rhodobacterales bacterium]